LAIGLEAYTADGLLTGMLSGPGRLIDLLEGGAPLDVVQPVLASLDGSARRTELSLSVDPDELLAVVAAPETSTPVHPMWHPMTVEVGPYRIDADLPSLPGFDPGRALARPSGSFVLVGRVRVGLLDVAAAADVNEHPFLWLNRYVVDGVASNLELGFFFPGAHAISGAVVPGDRTALG
jgi:hypothetical protein